MYFLYRTSNYLVNVDHNVIVVYNSQMITFSPTPDGFVFTNSEGAIALGVQESEGFFLVHKENMTKFNNAMQAYVHLRSIYEPKIASPRIMEVFTKPSRPVDNMGRFKDNPNLINMPKEVFHANLPN